MAERLQTICNHLAGENQREPFFTPCSAAGAAISTGSTGPFRYTLDNPKLTNEQRKFYEENGFFVVRNLVKQDALDEYREEFIRICKGEVDSGRMLVMRDVAIAKSEYKPGEQAVTKLQDFHENEVLFSYCKLPEVVDYVECFTGPNVIAMHTMLINKPPDPGKKTSRHPMHQDLHYFPFRPADRIVCSWTAMQHVHRENGCLVVIPGSHREGVLLEHGYPEWEGGVNKFYHGIKSFDHIDKQKMVHLEMQAGDTVFFHPLLIHGSGMNRTTGFRKSISGHYAGSDCDFIEVDGSTHKSLADEIAKVAEKKHDVKDLKFEYVWRVKSKLVRGTENPLSW